jgi:HNH endonuclease
MMGQWADIDEGMIDHKDQNGLNNAFSNLRQVTRSQAARQAAELRCGTFNSARSEEP